MAKNSKAKNFLRKNFYYILLGMCLVAVATIITLAVVLDKPVDLLPPADQTGGDIEPPDTELPDVPIVTDPLPFLVPISVSYTFGHTFTGEDGYVYSSTNGQYEGHLGLDFVVAAGTQVKASHDGKVISVDDDALDGLVISIQHADNIITTYRALDPENVMVDVGDEVERGDVIGTVAEKTLYELKMGPHLHFEVWENNEQVDPMDYLTELEK